MNNFTQDLFWKNMPFKKHIDKIGFTKDYWRSAKIKSNKPAFLFTGQSSINFNKHLSTKQLKRLKNIDELDIYLLEPVTYYNTNHPKPNPDISVHTRPEDLPFVKIPEFEDITIFKREQNIQKIRVFTCDYNVNFYFKAKYPDLYLYCYDTFVSSALGDFKHYKKIINKKFFCPNARFDTHRHLIMSYLANKSGHYTWYYRTYYDIKKNYWADDGKLPWEELYKGAELLNILDFPKNEHISTVDVYDPYDFYNLNFKNPVEDVYRNSITESFCCIVNETRFSQHTANFSEKTTFPIAYRTPFILVAPPYTLEYLKKLGFKTFDKWWDESYDNIEDHSQRMNKIFEVIDYINNKTLDELVKLYQEMLPTLEHNARNAINLKKTYSKFVFSN